MKTKLLITFSLFTFIGFAQAPVNSYYGTNNAVFSIIFDTGGINQAPSGANATWTFANVAEIGTSIDSETTPSAAELSDFPGTTNVVTTTSTIGNVDSEFKVYSKHPANVLSLTGIQNSGLLLNYSTNNAQLGLFPMPYGFSSTDNIAGNYDNGQYAGTFTGTINTSVDAWGTLTISGTPDINPFSGPVTRLRTVQNISLNYLAFNNIGTVTVTTNSYYNADLPNVPRFRSTVTTVNVPLLSINQTLTQYEVFKLALFGTQQMQQANQDVNIAPNPVDDVLNFQSGSQKIESVTLTDVTGKTILTDYSKANNINVSHLQKGIYFANIQTDSGSTVKKFIKK
jgi:hypothetical protein